MSEHSRLTANQEILIKHMLSFVGHESYRKEFPNPSNFTKREFHIMLALLRTKAIKERFPVARDFLNLINNP